MVNSLSANNCFHNEEKRGAIECFFQEAEKEEDHGDLTSKDATNQKWDCPFEFHSKHGSVSVYTEDE